MVVILERKLFQKACSEFISEASLLGTTSFRRITHLNSLETGTQHVTYFGKYHTNLCYFIGISTFAVIPDFNFPPSSVIATFILVAICLLSEVDCLSLGVYSCFKAI